MIRRGGRAISPDDLSMVQEYAVHLQRSALGFWAYFDGDTHLLTPRVVDRKDFIILFIPDIARYEIFPSGWLRG